METRKPLSAVPSNSPRPAAAARAGCAPQAAPSPRLAKMEARLRECEQLIDFMQTDDAAAARSKQKAVLKKYAERRKENLDLQLRLDEQVAQCAEYAASSEAELIALRAQLEAKDSEIDTNAREATENILELEAKLKRTQVELSATKAAGEKAGTASQLQQARESQHELQQQLIESQQQASRAEDELALLSQQHNLAQQDIQRLERRVRELQSAAAAGKHVAHATVGLPLVRWQIEKPNGVRRPLPGNDLEYVVTAQDVNCTLVAVVDAHSGGFEPAQQSPFEGALASIVDQPEGSLEDLRQAVEADLENETHLAPTSSAALSSCEPGSSLAPNTSVPTPVQIQPLPREPRLAGFLTKRSKGKLAKDGRRYFELFDLELCYDKDGGGVNGSSTTGANKVTIQLAHARCIPDSKSDCAFHLFTPVRSYSFAASSAAECQQWLAAVSLCANDAKLVLSSALHHGAGSSSDLDSAGYLVLANKKGKGKKEHFETDASKWSLRWWSLSEDNTLDCYARAPVFASPHPGDGAAKVDLLQQHAHLHELLASYELEGAQLSPALSDGQCPAFDLSLQRSGGGSNSSSTIGRFWCAGNAEAHSWMLRLQEAIKRTRDPHVQMRGYLTKESQSGTGPDSEHRRWFVVKDGAMRYYAKPLDARGGADAAIAELDLWNASLVSEPTEPHKPTRFELHTSNKTIGLLAPSVVERERWLQVIQRNIEDENQSRRSAHNHEGYLLKRGTGLVNKGSAESRWFSLRDSRLSCFKHQEDSKCRWVLDLSACSASLSLDKTTSNGGSLNFTITSVPFNTANASRRTLTLTAANARDFEVWVRALRSTIAAAKQRRERRRRTKMRRGRSPSCPNLALNDFGTGYDTMEAKAMAAAVAADGEADNVIRRRKRLNTQVLTEAYRLQYGHEARGTRLRERLCTQQNSKLGRRTSLAGLTSGLKQRLARSLASPLSASTAIVIECGSEYIRAGFSGEPAPRVVVPTVVMANPSGADDGQQQFNSGSDGDNTGMCFGWEAVGSQRWRELRSIFPRGSDGSSDTINGHSQIDWFGAVLPMLRHVLVDELGVEPAQHPLLLIEPTALTPNDREDLLDALFDELQITQLGMVSSAPVAMRAACTGGTTALVVSWGNTLRITPICDGTVEAMAVRTVRFGGAEVTTYLGQLLETQHGLGSGLPVEDNWLARLKETEAFVPLKAGAGGGDDASGTPVSGTRSAGSASLLAQLRSGVDLSGAETLLGECTELLFDPQLGGYDVEGVQHMIAAAIAAAPVDYRTTLLRHVVLVGGNTSFPGFPQRLEHELRSLSRCEKARVLANGNRKYQAWSGAAAALADDPLFADVMFTREDWHEHGLEVLNGDRTEAGGD